MSETSTGLNSRKLALTETLVVLEAGTGKILQEVPMSGVPDVLCAGK
jgi:hypothetical protein